MGETIKRADPTPVTVDKMMPHPSATGTFRAVMIERIPYNATSTATGAMRWVSQETGTVVAKVFLVFRTAGTGTIDVGITAAGTGTASDILRANAMAAGVNTRSAGSGTLGTSNVEYQLVGSGSGITVQHSDTTASTAVGELLIQYFLV